MIRFEGIFKAFGAVRALDGVSLEVPAGAVTVVAGPEGAGKSTLLKSAIGLVRLDGGRILLRGRPVGRDFSDIRRVAGYVPEKNALYPDLTVRETLLFAADIHGLDRRRSRSVISDLLAWSGLAPFEKRTVAALSGGMRQKLALCAALVPSPEILILDEPTTGIDPLSRGDVGRLIADLKTEGRTVLMSTADLSEVEAADAILYLDEGRTVLQGDVAALMAARSVRMLRLRPAGSVLDLLPVILGDPRLRTSVFIRGNALHCREEDAALLSGMDFASTEEVPAALEDICLFAANERERRPRA